ncbi:cupin domain-containing protein [Streptomyces sp. NPDC012389]|uniref:cupin domain-containing protein n=2 Tax=Streptomyces TaxID=1883 RepID=UPI0036E8C123
MPRAWSSTVLGRVGTAAVKVLRMDGLPVEEERHAEPEALLVLDGRLELDVEGEAEEGAEASGPSDPSGDGHPHGTLAR